MASKGDTQDIVQLIEELAEDTSIPKNVRSILVEIKQIFLSDKEFGVKIDTALQKVEDMTMDSNISSDTRMRLWNLTSLLEGALN